MFLCYDNLKKKIQNSAKILVQMLKENKSSWRFVAILGMELFTENILMQIFAPLFQGKSGLKKALKIIVESE